MKAIILAAGIGSRLGRSCPKPLTKLANGLTIMEMQIKNLLQVCDMHDIIAVVGYKKEMIIDRFPDLLYVYNPFYVQQNTAKSLLRALRKVEEDDVLWIVNGHLRIPFGGADEILDLRQGGSPCTHMRNV